MTSQEVERKKAERAAEIEAQLEHNKQIRKESMNADKKEK